MKRLPAFLLLLIFLSGACRASGRIPAKVEPEYAAPLSSPTPKLFSTVVPAEYQTTWDDLNASLDEFIASLPGSGGEAPILAAGLSYANGNVGESLLRSEVLSLVGKQLDAFAGLGIGGVVISIPFPLLAADFPRSAEYRQFYEQVGKEVHARGLKLLVESGTVFSGTIYSPLSVDWSQYTRESYLQGRQDQLLTIARDLQPDLLQIANEPTTSAMLTGFQTDPAEYLDFVRSSLQKFDRSGGMLIGAGAGTWEDPAYLEDLMQLAGLDFIDIHTYPIGRDASLLQLVRKAAQEARLSGKRVVISEAGLYKVDSSQLTVLSGRYAEIFSRDTYSFFEPLDEKYIRAVTLLARESGIEFVSFFWSRNLFAYLNYDSLHGLSDLQINQRMNQAAQAALQEGKLSPLGSFLGDWIAGQRK